MSLGRHLVVCVGLLLAFSAPVSAQLGIETPGLDRIELPSTTDQGGPILPPPPTPFTPSRPLSDPAETLLQVHRFEVSGATAFSADAINERLAPWLGRPIEPEELADARQALTKLYVDAGYVNSGARLPSQEVRDGVVRLEIVEGQLAEIEIEGARHYLPSVIEKRLRSRLTNPLNLNDLERSLRVLQEDTRIRTVDARLDPGDERGRARLIVLLDEAPRYSIEAAANNYRPPAVGSYSGILNVRDRNLMGFGDEVSVRGEVAQGLWRIEGSYTSPVNRWGTTVGLRGRYTESEVVGELDFLDIGNSTVTIGFLVDQPIFRTPNDTVSVGFAFDWRRSRSTLGGTRFSFSPGTENGQATVSVARVKAEWQHRDLHQVFVIRSTLSMGLDILDATMDGRNRPDGEYFTWLTQAQWARRLPLWGLETLVRFDSQLSNDPLLSLEQFATGGRYSVRGYSENLFVRDQGVIGGAELRIPIWREISEARYLQLAPFVDVAGSWNKGRVTGDNEWIASLGVALRARVWKGLFVEAAWAGALNDVDNLDDGPQARGFHFGLEWRR